MASQSISSKDVGTLIQDVRQAGHIALKRQRSMQESDRSYKADQSVVTAADREVEDFLIDRIGALFPQANMVTEESDHPFDDQRDLTVAIDPIDGTDVYSQGMPGWCVSVGLLDEDLIPRAGIIFAPRLDLLIVADPGEHVRVNGSPLPRRELTDTVSTRSNLMVTSRIHKVLDLSGYVGKIRSIGSAALHLCYPLIYGPVIAALEGPGIHIWDLVAAHAVSLAEGDDLCYLGGDPIDYGSMVDGTPGSDVVVAAHGSVLLSLRAMLKRLPSKCQGSVGKKG